MDIWQAVATAVVCQVVLSILATITSVAVLRAQLRHIEERINRESIQAAGELARLEEALVRANNRVDTYIIGVRTNAG